MSENKHLDINQTNKTVPKKEACLEGALLRSCKDTNEILATVEIPKPSFTTHECLVEISPIRMFNMNDSTINR